MLFALAGTVTLLSAALAATVSGWFVLLAAFVGVNQWVYVTVGACPASIVRRRAVRLRCAIFENSDRASTRRGGDGLMAVSEQQPRAAAAPLRDDYQHGVNVGSVGRLGRYTATHGVFAFGGQGTLRPRPRPA